MSSVQYGLIVNFLCSVWDILRLDISPATVSGMKMPTLKKEGEEKKLQIMATIALARDRRQSRLAI